MPDSSPADVHEGVVAPPMEAMSMHNVNRVSSIELWVFSVIFVTWIGIYFWLLPKTQTIH